MPVCLLFFKVWTKVGNSQHCGHFNDSALNFCCHWLILVFQGSTWTDSRAELHTQKAHFPKSWPLGNIWEGEGNLYLMVTYAKVKWLMVTKTDHLCLFCFHAVLSARKQSPATVSWSAGRELVAYLWCWNIRAVTQNKWLTICLNANTQRFIVTCFCFAPHPRSLSQDVSVCRAENRQSACQLVHVCLSWLNEQSWISSWVTMCCSLCTYSQVSATGGWVDFSM